APRTDTSLLVVQTLTGVKPNGNQLIGLQTVDQRAHFRAFSFRTCQHPFRIQRYDPGVLPLVTGLANGRGVEGCVAQHYDLGSLRQRQFRNHLRRQFGLGAVEAFFCLAVFARVIAPAKRHAYPARRNQQALDETMATLAGVLVFAVTPPFTGTTLAVARAESILRLAALLTRQRLIDEELKRPRPSAFHQQQLVTQDRGRRQAPQ